MDSLTFGEYGINWTSPQARGLVAWWPECRFDLVGGLNAIPKGGATWTPGDRGQSVLRTDGVDDYATCGVQPKLKPTINFSISLWVKTTATPAQYDSVFAQSSVGWDRGFGFYWESTPTPLIFWVNGWSAYFASMPVTHNASWLFIVGSYDGAKVNGYCNGVKAIGSNQTGNITYDGVGDFEIGRTAANANNHSGWIRDVRFYTPALTDAQVWHMFQPATCYDLYRPHRSPWLSPTVSGTLARPLIIQQAVKQSYY